MGLIGDNGSSSESLVIQSMAKTTNTDITTDIQNTTPTEIPLTGNQIIMDSDFEVSGNGIKCKFEGRVKVTAVISNKSPSNQGHRATGRIQSAINQTLQPVCVTWYNRTYYGSGQTAVVVGATLVDILDVSEDDVISIYNTLVSENRNIVLDTVDGSMLLIERLS